METEKFNNPELTQAEYEHYIEYIKTQFLENFDDIDAEIKSRIKSNFYSENFMKTSLNLALLISDTEKGKELFITLLEYVKSINPTLADTYWSLYDNEKTVIQRRFYKIQINKPPAEGKG